MRRKKEVNAKKEARNAFGRWVMSLASSSNHGLLSSRGAPA